MSFDEKGKESIRKHYLWYTDTSSYFKKTDYLDDKVKLLISFFGDRRVTAISKGKISAICDLVKAYREGAYEIDKSIVFLHDIAFVLMHSQKTRMQFVETFQKQTRLNNSSNRM